MLATFVLRLVPDALAEGRIVGVVEEVETGRRAVVRDLDELRAFLRPYAQAVVDLTVDGDGDGAGTVPDATGRPGT